MYQIIDQFKFIRAFESMGRKDQFSRDALELLFDHLESLDDGDGPGIELDVIGICCEYSEDSPDDIADSCSIDLSDCTDDDQKMETICDWLSENTTVVGETSHGTIVYAQF